MTTTLAPPPPPVHVAPGTDRGAPRRAIRRWAWRLLRREWRQQLLVLSLLVVAVAATTVGLGLVTNVESSDQAILGSASTRLDIANPGSGVDADVASARQVFGTVEAISHATVQVPGSVTPVDLRAQDPHGTYGHPMLGLVSGRYPTGPGQVAMTASVAALFNVHVGDTWAPLGEQLTVVGIVENPKDLGDAFALVAPGQLSAPSSLTILTNASGDTASKYHPPVGELQGIASNGQSAAQQRQSQALAVLLLSTIGLTFIGLLSVAGFTVLAQRRLRSLGMIGAIGATDRQVRRVLLANGVAVGTVGATLGTALGLGVWFALKPAFEKLVGHRIDPLTIPWWAVIAGALLAVLTSLGASWWPARAAARMPIVAALSGRPPQPQPAHRFAVAGAVLAAAGFVMLVLAHGVHTVLIVAGIVATTAGMLLLAPLGIRAIAATAARTPVAVRLALRDLGRYQARSGAAVAAAGLAVGIAATIAISAAAQQADDHALTGGNLPANQMIVWVDGPLNGKGGGTIRAVPTGGGGGADTGPSPAVIAAARNVAGSIARSLNAQHQLELDTANTPAGDIPAGSPRDAAQANLARPITENGHHGYTFVATPVVATPELLTYYGVPASAATSAQILTSRSDLTDVQLAIGGGRSLTPVTVSVVRALPPYTSGPNTVITESAAASFGLTPTPTGWLIQTHDALTPAQITDATHLAAAAGVAIETRRAPDHSLQQLRDYATLSGVLLALGVLGMTVGLIRSETAGDLRTLTAAGASGRTRRTLTGATAAALALLGGVIGVSGAYLALIAWHWHHVSYLGHPPYLDLASLVVGLPLLALAGAWLVGRTPTGIARQPME